MEVRAVPEEEVAAEAEEEAAELEHLADVTGPTAPTDGMDGTGRRGRAEASGLRTIPKSNPCWARSIFPIAMALPRFSTKSPWRHFGECRQLLEPPFRVILCIEHIDVLRLLLADP